MRQLFLVMIFVNGPLYSMQGGFFLKRTQENHKETHCVINPELREKNEALGAQLVLVSQAIKELQKKDCGVARETSLPGGIEDAYLAAEHCPIVTLNKGVYKGSKARLCRSMWSLKGIDNLRFTTCSQIEEAQFTPLTNFHIRDSGMDWAAYDSALYYVKMNDLGFVIPECWIAESEYDKLYEFHCAELKAIGPRAFANKAPFRALLKKKILQTSARNAGDIFLAAALAESVCSEDVELIQQLQKRKDICLKFFDAINILLCAKSQYYKSRTPDDSWPAIASVFAQLQLSLLEWHRHNEKKPALYFSLLPTDLLRMLFFYQEGPPNINSGEILD